MNNNIIDTHHLHLTAREKANKSFNRLQIKFSCFLSHTQLELKIYIPKKNISAIIYLHTYGPRLYRRLFKNIYSEIAIH